jgi:hypothetical protein
MTVEAHNDKGDIAHFANTDVPMNRIVTRHMVSDAGQASVSFS